MFADEKTAIEVMRVCFLAVMKTRMITNLIRVLNCIIRRMAPSARPAKTVGSIWLIFLTVWAGSGAVQPTTSATPKFATLSGFRTLIIAHRGGASEAPENTLVAFKRARQLGADGVEMDLRLTRDGKIVVYHDARVGRLEFGNAEAIPDLSGLIEMFANQENPPTNSFAALAETVLIGIQKLTGTPDGPLLSDLTYSHLKAIQRPGTGFARLPAKIPTLAEALRSVPDGMIDLDVKPGPRLNELLSKLIVVLKHARDLSRFIIEAPDQKSAQRLRAAFGPSLRLQVTPGLWSAEPFEKSLQAALELKPHSISVPRSLVTQELVQRAHSAGIEVWAWTIDSTDDARAMSLLGVDAIKTDRPSLLLGSFTDSEQNPNNLVAGKLPANSKE